MLRYYTSVLCYNWFLFHDYPPVWFEILCCSNLQAHVLVLQTGLKIFSMDDNYPSWMITTMKCYHPVVL